MTEVFVEQPLALLGSVKKLCFRQKLSLCITLKGFKLCQMLFCSYCCRPASYTTKPLLTTIKIRMDWKLFKYLHVGMTWFGINNCWEFEAIFCWENHTRAIGTAPSHSCAWALPADCLDWQTVRGSIILCWQAYLADLVCMCPKNDVFVGINKYISEIYFNISLLSNLCKKLLYWFSRKFG